MSDEKPTDTNHLAAVACRGWSFLSGRKESRPCGRPAGVRAYFFLSRSLLGQSTRLARSDHRIGRSSWLVARDVFAGVLPIARRSPNFFDRAKISPPITAKLLPNYRRQIFDRRLFEDTLSEGFFCHTLPTRLLDNSADACHEKLRVTQRGPLYTLCALPSDERGRTRRRRRCLFSKLNTRRNAVLRASQVQARPPASNHPCCHPRLEASASSAEAADESVLRSVDSLEEKRVIFYGLQVHA